MSTICHLVKSQKPGELTERSAGAKADCLLPLLCTPQVLTRNPATELAQQILIVTRDLDTWNNDIHHPTGMITDF